MSDSFVTPWTGACQAPLSTGFSRHRHWSGLPFSSSGELPDLGIEAASCIGRWILYAELPGKPLYLDKKSVEKQKRRCVTVCPL